MAVFISLEIEAPLNEPFEVKYVIQPSIKTSANSGVRTIDITQQHVGKPTKEIDDKNYPYSWIEK